MPKVGMEPIRRAALVQATIDEIGEAGSLDVTVGQIAKRAGVSSGLAHHYFGTKDAILLSAMRHILRIYGDEVQARLSRADGPRERLEAIAEAGFAPSNFRPEVVAAWLTFYVKAQQSDEVARLLRVYQTRLRSNLLHELRPLLGEEADLAAAGIAAMIDGVYIRQSLRSGDPDPNRATALVRDYIDRVLP